MKIFLLLTLAVAFVVAPIGTSSVLASGYDVRIEPEAYVCDPGWRYYKTSSSYSMQFSKVADGTHYINQTGSNMTYTSTLSTAVTAGFSVSGSVQGGFGPINASLGFTANASITLTASDAVAITIPNKYEGWNEFGSYRDSNTGWYYYLNSNCSESDGHFVTTISPREKAIVARTRYVGVI